MSRAVVISVSSRILFKYWHENFKTWSHLVDKLYIGNNTGADLGVDFPNEVVNNVEYPSNLESLLKTVTEDQILIMHDDVFVYDSFFLNMCFELAKTSVVTPIHNSHNGNEPLESAMQAKFGHKGSFFPYFLFVSREAINKTSINLHEYKSDLCPILGVPANGDQGFLLCLELQQAGYKILPIRRYLAHEFPDNPPYVHAQGISYNFLAGLGSGADEYKVTWLIEFLGLDFSKITELNKKLFGEKHEQN